MIGIIDYGMGNLRSVQKAFESLGHEARILASPAEVSGVQRLVLPGVGAFANGMDQLRERGWIGPIRSFAASGKPFLGVCLGMQLLFDSSEEGAASPEAPVPGLGLLPGRVVRFPGAFEGERLKVPHMGWNTLTWRRDDPLLRGLHAGDAVYFVHSYYACPRENGRPIGCASSDYAGPFCASIWRDNLWATQFHPEKSQRIGLRMLQNFASL